MVEMVVRRFYSVYEIHEISECTDPLVSVFFVFLSEKISGGELDNSLIWIKSPDMRIF